MDRFFKDFVKLGDGHWVCIENTTLIGPQGRIQVAKGTAFVRGTSFMGIDLAQWLDEYSTSHTAPPGWHSPNPRPGGART